MADLTGTNNSDTIQGTANADTINGAGGNDTIYATTGGDIIDGGDGIDLLDLMTVLRDQLGRDYAVNAEIDGPVTAEGQLIVSDMANIEALRGGGCNDTLWGALGNEALDGSDGDDQLFGRAGDDTLSGGNGDDTIDGDIRHVPSETGNDLLTGGGGADTFSYQITGWGNDTITDFTLGTDRIDMSGTTLAFSDLTITQDGTDALIEDGNGNSIRLQNVTATDITATDLNLSTGIIEGTPGDDTLAGTTGTDTIHGLGGNDTIYVTTGSDVIDGGSGADLLDLMTALRDQFGHDVAVNAEIEGTVTAEGQLIVSNMANIEALRGGACNDTLWGNFNNDALDGSGGDDLLTGRAGNDTLIGGSGNDTLTGGDGADTFSYQATGWGTDTITDFTKGSDQIDMSGTGLAFDDLTITQDGTDALIEDGNGNSVRLQNVTASDITASDLNLPSGPVNGTTGNDHYNNDGNIQSVDLGAGNDTLENDGDITLQTASPRDYAVTNDAGSLTVINRGTILGGDDEVYDPSSEARYDRGIGIRHTGDGNLSVSNAAGATIEGGYSAVAVEAIFGGDNVPLPMGHTVINNAGTLHSGNDTILIQGGSSAITNSGTITSDGEALQFDGPGVPWEAADAVAVYAYDDPETTSITNTATGVISGWRSGLSVHVPGTIDNSGLIEGGDGGILASATVTDGRTLAITNDGTIRQIATGPQGAGLNDAELMAGIVAGIAVSIDNSGVISGVNHGIWASRAIVITNSGTITGDTDTDGTGVAIRGTDGTEYTAGASGTYASSSSYADRLDPDLVANVDIISIMHIPAVVFGDITALLQSYVYDEASSTWIAQFDGEGREVYDSFTSGGETYDVTYDTGAGAYLITDSNGDTVYQLVNTEGWLYDILNADGSYVYDVPDGATFNDRVTNSGTIVGDVSLGWGNDQYQGVGSGTVSGTVDGGLGNDTLLGGNGNDVLSGGEGTDTLDGGAGSDTLLGGAGNDILWGGIDTSGNNYLDGGLGDDSAYGACGDDMVIGGDGNDTIRGWDGADVLSGGDGMDVLEGDEGTDTLTGGSGADLFVYDTNGLGGRDWGNDTITDYEHGTDQIDMSGTGLVFSDLTITQQGNDALIEDDRGNSIRILNMVAADITASDLNITESHAGTTLVGTAGGDTLIGGAGADSLAGGGGADSLAGGGGNDTISGGTGNDTLVGGSGNDLLEGGAGADLLSGGAGNDTASYAGSSAGVNVSLSANTSSAQAAASQTAGSGDGGAGGFTGIAGSGKPDPSVDTPPVPPATAGFAVDTGDQAADQLAATGGDAEGDTFDSIENLVGSGYDDTLEGNAQDNRLTGSAGNDTFVFGPGWGSDTITDFTVGEDQIHFRDAIVTSGSLTITDVAGGALVQDDVGNSILLTGVAAADLSTDNFSFDIANSHISDNRAFDSIGSSGDRNIDGILMGYRYAEDEAGGYFTLTYSFPNEDSQFFGYTASELSGLTGLSSAAQGLFIAAFDMLEQYTDLRFLELADVGETAGTLRAAWTSYPRSAYAWSNFPNYTSWPHQGDTWFSSVNYGETFANFNTVLLHEFGHALGLSHAFYSQNGFGTVESQYNGWDYTVMAYAISARYPGVSTADLYPTSFMSLDIRALQYLYGTDFNSTSGDDEYVFDLSERYYFSLWDSGGNDTIRVVGGDTSVDIDLRGGWANVGTTITYDNRYTEHYSVYLMEHMAIENLYGANGDDTLVGNSANNDIGGGNGDDQLYGVGGNDTLAGGAGNDNLQGGEGQDVLVGGVGADSLYGGEGDDSVSGGEGGDTYGFGSDWGNDVIEDFDDGADTIDLRGTGIGGISDLTLSTQGSDVLISDGAGNSILVKNTDISALTDADFLFGDLPITGTANNDSLVGTGLDEIISGLAGNDTIEAGGGNDTIDGGGGNDRISAGGGTDRAQGGLGNDTIDGGDGDDTVHGGADRDLLIGGDGDDMLLGEDGDDRIDGGTGNDAIDGGEGSDRIAGGDSADLLAGGNGDDSLAGDAGDDAIDGGAGRDTLWGGTNDDLLTGGACQDSFMFGGGWGNDTITDFTVGEDIIDLRSGTVIFEDLIIEQNGNDALISDGNGNIIRLQNVDAASLGPDNVLARGYDDEPTGSIETARSVAVGEVYSGTLEEIRDDDWIAVTLRAGGVYQIDLSGGGSGRGTLRDTYLRLYDGDGLLLTYNDDGGPGYDSRLVYTATVSGTFYISARAYADAYTGTYEITVNLIDFEDQLITGTSGADSLVGDAGDDTIVGNQGNDTLVGLGGDDIINGGDDNDILLGGAGADSLDGGNDDDVVNGWSGNDVLFGGNGDDLLLGGEHQDILHGGCHDDSLKGCNDNDTLYGDDGSDILSGGNGDDRIDGGTDNDAVSGDAGDDRLSGGQGDDILTGGSGADSYFFYPDWGHDTIADFEVGVDRISLAPIGGNFDDLTITQQGSDTLITHTSGNTILLEGITASDLTSDHFSFGITVAEILGITDPWTALPDTGYQPTVEPLTSSIDVPNDLTIDAEDVLFSQGMSVLLTSYNLPVLTNNGTIWAENTGYSSVSPIHGGNWLNIYNNGRIVGITENGTANGVYVGAWGILQNSGEVFAISASGTAFGYQTWSPGAWSGGDPLNLNTGTIHAWSGNSAAYGVNLYNGGEFENTGDLIAEGYGGATGFTARHYFDLTNSGTIRAESATGSGIGIELHDNYRSVSTVNNSGTIDAAIAIQVTRGQMDITNSGLINGNVILENNFSDTVINTGTINGRVFLGDGDDILSSANGVINGEINAGSGDDTLYGGTGDDTIWGDDGSDVIVGGAGDDKLHGGWGADRFKGLAGHDTIRDFTDGEDLIDMTGSNIDDIGDVTISASGANTLIEDGNGNQIVLLDVDAATITADDFLFEINAAYVLGITNPWAPIPDSGPRPDVAPGSTLTLEVDHLTDDVFVNGSSTAGVTIPFMPLEAYTIDGDIWIQNLVTSSQVLGLGSRENAVTINSTITAIGDARTYGLHQVGDGGSFTNNGTISAYSSGEIAYGVYRYGDTAADENHGIIRAWSNDSHAFGIQYNGAGVLENTGTISVFGFLTAQGVRIGTNNGVTLTNSGTISAVSGQENSSYGVWAYGGSVINNSGLIEAEIAIRIDNGGGGTRITNAGTINGIVMLGSGDDTLDSSAGILNGSVDAGYGNDYLTGSSAGDTLAGGAGNDTLSGGAGNDVLAGGDGSDIFFLSEGNDTVSDFNTSVDRIDFHASGMAFSDLSITQDGADAVISDGQGRSIRLTGVDADALTDAHLVGETLYEGTACDDLIEAHIYDESLSGGAGNDTLVGGGGNDTLTGGAGADAYRITPTSGNDIITDFSIGEDIIDIRGLYISYDELTFSQDGSDAIVTTPEGQTIRLEGVDASALTEEHFQFGNYLERAWGPYHDLWESPPDIEAPPSDTDPRIDARSDITIGADDFILSGYQTTVSTYSGSYYDLLNQGTLRAEQLYGGSYDTTTAVSWGRGSIENQGSILTVSEGSYWARGVLSWGDIVNTGDISIIAAGRGGAIVTYSQSSSITNEGSVSAWATTEAYGIVLGRGATSIDNSGTIEARAENFAIGIDAYGYAVTGNYPHSGTYIVNTGSIIAEVAGDHNSYGIFGFGTVLNNAGLISAKVAANNLRQLNNTGSMIGDVHMISSDSTAVNSGNIVGDVFLLAGDDRFQGAAGTVTGIIDGGDGNDQIVSGLGDDMVLGGNGDDTIDGGLGNDLITGGDGADVIILGSGGDTLTDFEDGIDRIGIESINVAFEDLTITQQGDDVLISDGNGQAILLRNMTAADITEADFLELIGSVVDGSDGNDVLAGTSNADLIRGFDGHDSLTGLGCQDTLEGGNGDDTLNGGGDDDVLEGGDGADLFVISANSGTDTITDFSLEDAILYLSGFDFSARQVAGNVEISFSNSSNKLIIQNASLEDVIEQITGPTPGEVVNGTNGEEAVVGTSGNDTLNGRGGHDLLLGGGGDDVIDGGSGPSTVSGGSGDDRIRTDNDADTIIDSYGDDTVEAGGGDDTIQVSYGNDRVFAGDGDDLVEGGDGDDYLNVGNGNDSVDGGDGDDVIVSTSGNSTLSGGDGNDRIYTGSSNALVSGGKGDDTIIGDNGAVTLSGDQGNDLIEGSNQADLISGGDGDDTLWGYRGSDTLDGGDGTDTAYFDGESQAVSIDLSSGTATTATGQVVLRNIENASGTNEGDDTLVGSDGANYLGGQSGNDNISGGGGADRLSGGSGNDTLEGESGDDTLTGGTGGDTFRFRGDWGADVIGDYEAGVDTIDLSNTLLTSGDVAFADVSGGALMSGGAGNSILFAGVSVADINLDDFLFTRILNGTDGDDRLTGDAQDNSMWGGCGDDVMDGGAGADSMVGGDGDDRLDGGTGNDTLEGGAGADLMIGGDGMDLVMGGSGDDTVQAIFIEPEAGASAMRLEAMALTGGRASADIVLDDSIEAPQITVSEDGLTYTYEGGRDREGLAVTEAQDSGQHYWEITLTDVPRGGGHLFVAIAAPADSDWTQNLGDIDGSLMLRGNGQTIVGDGRRAQGDLRNLDRIGEGDVIGVAFDADTGAIWISINGVWQNGATAAEIAAGDTRHAVMTGIDVPYVATAGGYSTSNRAGHTATFTFDANSFSYSAPEGYSGYGSGANVVGDTGDTLDGGDGIDWIDLSNAPEGIIMGDSRLEAIGDSTIAGDIYRNFENIRGSSLGDQLNGGNGDNVINGGDGNDTLSGGNGDDTIIGGDGDDVILGVDAGDVIDGGAGYDVISYAHLSDGQVINVSPNHQNIEAYEGSTGDDTITGGEGEDSISGGDGDDVIDGGNGDDTLDGGLGVDTLVGSGCEDNIDLANGTASGGMGQDAITGFEAVAAGDKNDTVTGDDNDNILMGEGGDDRLMGGCGDDTLVGGVGADTFVFEAGFISDVVADFTSGDDVIDLSRMPVTFSSLVITQDGVDAIVEVPDHGEITLVGVTASDLTADDFYFGETTLDGTAGDDLIEGLFRDETLSGFAGDDTLLGGEGVDLLLGGEGNDLLDGGAGADIIMGGCGDDTVQAFAGASGSDKALEDDSHAPQITVSEDGLTYTYEGGRDREGVAVSEDIDSGQFYWEITLSDVPRGGGHLYVAIAAPADSDWTQNLGDIDGSLMLRGNGQTTVGDGRRAQGGERGLDSVREGDVIGVAFDADTGAIWISINGEWQNGATASEIAAGNTAHAVMTGIDVPYVPTAGGYSTSNRAGHTATFSFDEDGFNFAAPDGFAAYGTAGAPEGGNDTVDGGDDIDAIDFSGLTAGVDMTGVSLSDAGGALIGADLYQNFENIIGSCHDDLLNGGDGDNMLSGGQGDDTLIGGAGDDMLEGGAGADLFRLTAGFGSTVITDFTVGTDRVDLRGSGYDYWDIVDGLTDVGGIATFDDGNGNVLTFAGLAAGTIGVDDFLFGGSIILGTHGDDTVEGTTEADYIIGLDGEDSLYGDAGDDTLLGSNGDDTLDGGEGFDHVSLTDGDDRVNLNTGVAEMGAAGEGTDVLIDIEAAHGGCGDDTLIGSADDEQLTGDAGDDALMGAEGDDTLAGGSGADSFVFGDGWGNDLIQDFALGTDILDFSVSSLAFADLTITDVDGDAVVSDASGNSITLAGVSAASVSENDFSFGDTVTGTAGDDSLTGSLGRDSIVGLAGDDTIRSGDGLDTIDGGDGNDWLEGGAGADNIVGGSGDDTVGAYAGEEASTGAGLEDASHASQVTISDDLTYTYSGGRNREGVAATDEMSSGQHYWEITLTDVARGGSSLFVAIAAPAGSDWTETLGTIDGSLMLRGNGQTYVGDGRRASRDERGLDSVGEGDVIGVAFDSDAGAIWISINGEWQNGATEAEIAAGDTRHAVVTGITEPYVPTAGGYDSSGRGGHTATFSFSTEDLTYSAPTGFSPYGGAPMGGDMVDGGDGLDIIDFGDMLVGVDMTGISLSDTGGALIGGDLYQNFEGINGSCHDDLLNGGLGDNRLSGGCGDDTIIGGAGDDTLTGGLGADLYSFASGFGSDMVTDFNTSADMLDLRGAGFNFAQVLAGLTQDGADAVFDAGDGNILRLTGVTATDVTVANFAIEGTVRLGTAAGDTLTGDDDDDYAIGLAGNDRLSTGGGSDTLDGGAGNDTLIGDSGDDTLVGGAGNDQLVGGSGSDRFVMRSGDGNDTIADFDIDEDILDLSATTITADTLLGRYAEETTSGGTAGVLLTDDFGGTLFIEGLSLGDLMDAAILFSGDTEVPENASGQRIRGSNRGDAVTGTDGDDLIDARRGDDTIDGGLGDDTITGNRHDDRFVLSANSGNDVITDLDSRDDTLDLSGVAASFNTLSDVLSAAYETSHGRDDGVLIDLGGSNSVFLEDISLAELTQVTILGDSGALLDVAASDDELRGTSGADVFTFAGNHGNDVISGFDPAADTLDLTGINTPITNLTDAMRETVLGRDQGVLIDTGGGNTIFIEGVSIGQMVTADVDL